MHESVVSHATFIELFFSSSLFEREGITGKKLCRDKHDNQAY
jgi:hypothetical protein